MRTDLIWRTALPAAGLVALVAGAPQPVSGGLALAALALATERLVALRETSLGDRVLVGVGGTLVALVLTGIVLDATGLGLRPTTWIVALVVLSAVGLLVAGFVPARPRAEAVPWSAHRRTTLRALPWVAVAVLVTVVAVRMSASSLSAADAPPLQMSFGKVSGTDVQVVVTSTDAVGPLELRTSAGGDDISYPLFSLREDGSSTTTVSLPRSGRFVVTLNYPDQTEPLRTLVLDR